MQPQRIKLHAQLIDDYLRGRGQGGTLGFEPQLGAGDHLLRIALLEFRAPRHLGGGIADEHRRCDKARQRGQHHTPETDPVEDRSGDARRHEDRKQSAEEHDRTPREVLRLELRRSAPDAPRPRPVRPAVALHREAGFRLAQDAVGFAGAVCHYLSSASSDGVCEATLAWA